MKVAAIFILALTGLVSSEKLPTFTWLDDQASPDGVPLLAIRFHDGNPDDVAVLKEFNPVPRQPHEKEENIDKCIFVGHLRDEPSAHVTLTGGCPFEDKLNIIMWSKRSSRNMFSMSNGVVAPIASAYKTKGLISDIALRPPGMKKPVPSGTKQAPSNARMNVAMNIDQSFQRQFGGDAENVVRRLVANANAWYHHPTLGSSIEFIYGGGVAIPDTIEASEGYLNYVAQYNQNQYNTNVYLCYQNNQPGVVGIAWIGTICGPQSYQTAVVEYFNNEVNSGEILAHEVGHNLGMDHDFVGQPGNPRYDSFGRSCTNIGGVMDYYQTVSQWSSCSVEDYQGTYTGCLG